MQPMWTQSDIKGDPLFYTQPTQQPTIVYPDDEEGLQEGEDTLGPDQPMVTDASMGGGKKRGENHRTFIFRAKEDEVICVSWLAVSQDSINGAHQKGHAYWRKVSQGYNERKLHKPFAVIINHNEESIKKIGLHQARDIQVLRCDRTCPYSPEERHVRYCNGKGTGITIPSMYILF
jgi:hypothetical protein